MHTNERSEDIDHRRRRFFGTAAMTLAAAQLGMPVKPEVSGGLLLATPTTLLVVPYLFALLRKRNDGKAAHGVFAEIPE